MRNNTAIALFSVFAFIVFLSSLESPKALQNAKSVPASSVTPTPSAGIGSLKITPTLPPSLAPSQAPLLNHPNFRIRGIEGDDD